MTRYFRPIARRDAPRPEGALALAGHSHIWFDTVEVLRRDGPSELIAAREVPSEIRDRLTAPRANFGGFDFDAPVIMGVLNVTPDSFSDGGRFDGAEAALAHTREMLAKGAHLIDVGGESTRPGAAFVPAKEELARIVPVITALRQAGVTAPISIDTRKAEVARAALAAGATMLNDVSAMSFDPQMADIAVQSGAPICLMHAQGDPKTMQKDPVYEDVLLDVYDDLEARIAYARAAGIARAQIVIDPGIGFGKTLEHNLALIRGLSLFHGLGCPILLGVSRKRFIGVLGAAPEADRRAAGSLAVALEGLAQAVQIIRVHDIEEHAQGFALWQAMLNKTQSRT